jgi:pyruvate dehydrogenase E1 component beta subunit
MKAAIRDDNPVVFLQHFLLTLEKGDVPEGDCVIPFGVAEVKRAGTDVTIVATGWMVQKSLAAAEALAKEGISAEVIDPRTIAPLDVNTIVNSVKKTGRLVLVDQAPRHASVAVVIAGEIAEHAFSYLKAPVRLVTAADTPVPFSEPLENFVLPDANKITQAVKSVLQRQATAV